MSDTPRTDGFEIVVAGESPILGNRYRAWADFARTLERELAARQAAYLDNRPNGEWIDQWGSCRVCGGEIPHGHMPKCDVYRYERVERAADGMAATLKKMLDYWDKHDGHLTTHFSHQVNPDMKALSAAFAAYRAEKDKETT